ncbi:uncharacterized protein LOC100201887 [Hydra vulgaris]|uniref:Uncharacterized protein LOC100201887 n=1 Tax=Hydra vulgaris TaxID=6087 RepID=A0ABM4CJM6_HYDVU
MDGYDADFVNEVPLDLECGICLFVVREPVQILACGHRFCSHCFENLKKLPADRLRCPKDNASIDTNKVFPDTAALRTVSNLTVRCSKTGEGCLWQGALRELENHLKDCSFNNPKNLIQEHMLNQISALEEALKKKDQEYLHLKNENFRLEQEFIKFKKETENSTISTSIRLDELLVSYNDLSSRIQQVEKRKKADSITCSLPNQNTLKETPKILIAQSKVINLVKKPAPCYVWKMNRNSGSRQTSPKFYSSDKGYLCQLKARKSVHLCLDILKGDFDWQLVWPFNMKVEFVCFNKFLSERHSLVYPFKKKDGTLSAQAHASYDYAVFLTPAVMNSCIVDDVISIEVYIS